MTTSKKRHPAAPRQKAKGERAIRPTPSKLNARQQKLRRLLIMSGGQICIKEAAAELKASRVTIWQDRIAIKALGDPTNLEGWSEDNAIQAAIEFYEGGIGSLLYELERIAEYEKKTMRHDDQVQLDYTMSTVKLGIYNALAVYRRDLSNFLIQIGLIREAPKRLILDDERVSTATTDTEIRDQIGQLRTMVEQLRERRLQFSGAQG